MGTTASELQSVFLSNTAKLKAFLLRLTASVPDVEDIMQETFLRASQKLETYREESSLSTWLFAIAMNIAKDNLRAQKRWTENVTDLARAAALNNPAFFQEAMHIHQTSPQGQFEVKEHIAFCFTCIAKSLPIEKQICLLLKEVHGFKITEVASIVDISEAMVKYHLHAARAKMIEIFDGRCSLINKEGACHQCSELNGIFNPKQKIQEELMKVEMAKQANSANADRLLDLRLQIVQTIDPFQSAAADLQLHHLEHNRKLMD